MILYKDGKVLMGKRKNSHGAGAWSFPGGHLEFMEEIEDCAKREVLEETGVEIKNIERVNYTNDFYKDLDKHYITCFVKADYASGEVQVMEPEKCESWEWFSRTELPSPLFLPIENLLKLDPKLI